MKNALLLHQCCAPCTPVILAELSGRFSVRGWWYNPNIQPGGEHDMRRDAARSYLEAVGIDFEQEPAGDPTRWVSEASMSSDRCRYCYETRMKGAAAAAAAGGCGFLSTTLLASPFQRYDLIVELGTQAARSAGIEFIAPDIRPRYYEGVNEARARGLYRQNYCGCLFSRQEARSRTSRPAGAAR